MSETAVRPQPRATSDSARPPVWSSSLRDTGTGAAWLHVAGELDSDTAPALGRMLARAELRARLVVLDLRELRFIDSSGVRVIVYATLRARRVGRRLILVRGPAPVDCVFALSGASELVEIGDLDPVEPPVQMLLQIARKDAVA